MEPRFGQDFGNVRIHRDERAAGSARAVDSLAFTVGHDIAFAAELISQPLRGGLRPFLLVDAHVVHTGDI